MSRRLFKDQCLSNPSFFWLGLLVGFVCQRRQPMRMCQTHKHTTVELISSTMLWDATHIQMLIHLQYKKVLSFSNRKRVENFNHCLNTFFKPTRGQLIHPTEFLMKLQKWGDHGAKRATYIRISPTRCLHSFSHVGIFDLQSSLTVKLKY